MVIYFDDRPCGSGKTYNELLFMVQNPGRYLLAVDRLDVMRERVATLRELSQITGMKPVVVVTKSGQLASVEKSGNTTIKTSRAVRTDVEAIPHLHNLNHVIAIITHEALKASDLADFSSWNLVIDETPSIWDQRKLRTTLSREFLQSHYDLEQVGSRCIVTSKSGKTAADFRRDSLTQDLTVMHARICDRKMIVLADVASWDDLGEEGRWTWTSIFSPLQLGVFEKVKILANAFTRSLTFEVLSKVWPEITWLPECRHQPRSYLRRKMRIRYFAASHAASRSLFDSDEGKHRLRKISEFIADEVDPDDHIWTCNDDDLPSLKEALARSQRLSPRQSGSNAYSHLTTVSAIYSAKPTPSECGLFHSLGVDPQTAIESREYETIFQFVGRCSVRDPQSTEQITVHVYDLKQAEYLQELFTATNYVDCELSLVDLGFADRRAPKPGRRAMQKSESEIAAQRDRKRLLARERKRRQRARENERREFGGILPPDS